MAQQTPTCHGQYRRFLENSSSPTHCHVTLRPKEHMSLKWLFQNRISHSFVSKSSLKAKTQILLIFCLKGGLGRLLSSDFCFILGFFGQSLPGIKKKKMVRFPEKEGVQFYLYFSLPLCLGRSGEQSPFLAHKFFFFLPVRLRFFSVFVFVHFVVNLIKEEKGIAKLLNNNYLSACVQWCRQCCFT